MGKFSRLGNHLYSGEKSIDFVGRRRLWYSISAVIMVVAGLALVFKPLDMGIEFVGGAGGAVGVAGVRVQVAEVQVVACGRRLPGHSRQCGLTRAISLSVRRVRIRRCRK